MTKASEPISACDSNLAYGGLTKREYFAAMAVVTEKEIDRFTSELTDYDPLVAEAWIRLKKADALINELNK